jgi:carbamate kinase
VAANRPKPRAAAVLAVGGNALAPSGRSDPVDQAEGARHVAAQAVAMCSEGRGVLVVHGNGPQVGGLALAHEAIARELPMQPLFALGAMTQGQLGYALAQAVGDAQVAGGGERRVAAIATQVVVRADDPGFSNPTKPIGPFFSEGRAHRLAEARGWSVAEDSGRGWRRVVPSPDPIEIVEVEQIRRLLDAGDVVIACGGGGVPVVRQGNTLTGVEAVIDKDYAAALLASLVGASTLLLVTGVDRVALDFGKPTQRDVLQMTLAEARQHLADGQFPPGSMGPKVDACIRYVEGGGGTAIICSLEQSALALDGKAGTRIVP